MNTYLTTEELSTRLKYTKRYINNVLRPQCLAEGRHFVRPFGGRKILYIWETIEQDMFQEARAIIPMANGGVCHG